MEQQHAHGQSPHDDIHLPDPSPWPLVAALAAIFLGGAIVWWANDQSNNLAAALIGAAVVSTLLAAAGWAWEDSRMRRKAEQHAEGAAPTRYTQVITFLVPEGKLEAARGKGGVLETIDASDSALRNLRGFQDLRITVSPAATGPSQVLVETTWSDREGLASYEETRQTILDILAQHEDQVVPGSVQVFDMEVVRDTKDVAMRFSLGAAATLIGAVIVGGFMIGAGLTLFQEEATVASEPGSGGETPSSGGGFAETGVIVARNLLFDVEEIRLPPNVEVTLTLDNQDAGVPHNIQFHDSPEPDPTAPLLKGCISGCPSDDVATPIENGPVQQTFTFVTPGPGRYSFLCIVHPNTMTGVLIVEEGAPIPGQAPAQGTSGAGQQGSEAGAEPTTIVGKDLEFNVDEIHLPPNVEVTLAFDNQDAGVPHNIQFHDSPEPDPTAPLLKGCISGCPSDDVATPIENGPVQQTLTFVTPGPGRYAFLCVVHPTTMRAILVVEEGGG